jgi:Zn-dependent peptidase ImmA (M78 family)
MDRSSLAKIELGRRRVTAIELARIADALDERIEWLVTDPPAAVMSHRNVQDPSADSPTIDRMVERIARNVEFVARHDGRWAARPAPQLDRPVSVQAAERAGEQARSLLGLDTAGPLLDATASTTSLGLLPFSLDLGRDSADAASILLPAGGVALVNGHLRVDRRRLALMHEMGHYLFADEYTVDWRVAQDDEGWEGRLDRFGRTVLLPAPGLQAIWAELTGRGEELRTVAVRTASAFRVDMSTLARRLHELRLASESECRQIRAARTTRADIVELDLVASEELAPPQLPRVYEEAVLRLYRSEVVSAARATDLLLDVWAAEDLPELPPRPEGAIWEIVT